MKVLHVITGLNIGGAENMLAKLIEQGGATNHEVLSLLSPGPIAERIRAKGVKIHTLRMRRGIAGPASMLRLSRMVKAISPDLLHGWMYHGNLAASFARWRSGTAIPLVWNIRHSIPDLGMETRQTRLLLKLSASISRGPDAIVYNAHVSRKHHEEIGYAAKRGTILPNGFDTARFSPASGAREVAGMLFGFAEGAFRIACIARLHPMKDQARLVRAVIGARQRGCDAHLLLVGHGLEHLSGELEREVGKLAAIDRVTLSGARSDVSEWLPGIDVLAVPSAWGEAFPNVIGEALSCGVPVVATDVGDSARIVGNSGIVVPPNDTEAMTGAILAMAGRPASEREAIGRSGRQRVLRDFALADIASRYDALHAACIAEKLAKPAAL